MLVAAGDDLLARLDHHRVGRLSEIVPVRRVEPVPEHVSSDPGPDGEATLQRELERDHRPNEVSERGSGRKDARPGKSTALR